MYASSPVTVTVCAMLQLVASNVSVVSDSVPSVGSPASVIVTGAVGLLVRATANDADVPASDVVSAVGATLKPATSTSVFVTVTGDIVRPLKRKSSRLVA